jgi:PIN domain nuclease of toxin-antitoxin system
VIFRCTIAIPSTGWLVAQAIVKRLTIVSHDREIAHYPVPVIEA